MADASSTQIPKYIVPRFAKQQLASWYTNKIDDHRSLLANVTPDFQRAQPLMMITVTPSYSPSLSSSDQNYLVIEQYKQIERDLDYLRTTDDDDDKIEIGAVDTAKALVAVLKDRQIAPPEISWMGGEAIILLWAMSHRKLALTITDGELGYVARANGETIAIKSNIAPQDFDLIRLR